jgi:hypothetical protein
MNLLLGGSPACSSTLKLEVALLFEPSKNSTRIHGVILHKIILFTVTVVRTSTATLIHCIAPSPHSMKVLLYTLLHITANYFFQSE